MAGTADDLTPAELAVQISSLLAEAGIRHAIGGALAFGFYASPRGTVDVDMNIFVAADRPHEALDVLAAGGVAIDREQAVEAIGSRGDLFVEHGGCRLDFFFNSIPLHASASERARTVELLGTPVPVLSAEDLVVLKLLFNRHKDIVDIEAIVESSGDKLDVAYVRHWLVECVGSDDTRVATWEGLLGEAVKRD